MLCLDSQIWSLSHVCAKARPPKKCCTLDLISTLSILLYPFATMQDRLLELAMEVLQHKLQTNLVEQGSGLHGAALSVVSEQAVGWSRTVLTHLFPLLPCSCLSCCSGTLFPLSLFSSSSSFLPVMVFVARTALTAPSHSCP